MTKIFNLFFIFIFFKLSAQSYFTPQLDKVYDIPQKAYDSFIGDYLNINIEKEYKQQGYKILFTDFGLRKDKPVRELIIDGNTDGVTEYVYQFNKDGTISHLNDYVDNHNRSYEYYENLIVIKDVPITKYKGSVFLTSIDSLFLDQNKNIIKEAYSDIVHNGGEPETFNKITEYRFSKTNQLEKKYSYSIRKKPGYKKGFTDGKETFYENYKDSIVERAYFYSERKTELAEKTDETKGLISKSVYYLNGSGNANRIKIFYSSLDLHHDFLIDYDKFGRISGYKDRDRESCLFEYNKNGKIFRIRKTDRNEPETIFNYIYDANGRFIYGQKEGEKEKVVPRSFTYEKFGNWQTVTWDSEVKKIKFTTLITRKISYY